MTAGIWSGIVTGALMLAFLGGVGWVWSGARRAEFDEASRLPLDDETGAEEKRR